jgi:bifunctional UDP-N-acetylglucosamine pyrophosphorylase/glucosamine-1-phosphate N-acetyltransferase
MTASKIGAIVLGAGKGTRMKSDLPKVLQPICGKSMIRHIIDSLEALGVEKIVTVIAKDGGAVKKEVAPYDTCTQSEQLGTADAVLSAKEMMKDFDGDILVIFGDHPLTTPETYKKMAAKRKEGGYSVVVLGFVPKDPARYGRLKMKDGVLEAIVEYKDATEEERAITLCNSGIMCFDGKKMFDILEKIGNNNATGEYYLTDAISISGSLGYACGVVECSPDEVSGANTLEELAELEKYYIKRQGGCK